METKINNILINNPILFNCLNCKDKNYLIECACGCGQLLFKINKINHNQKFIHGHNGRGSLNKHWKGGRIKDSQGYWKLLKPDYYSSDKTGYVFEHVYNYQEFHQCCMLPWGVVHHINKDKTDNRCSDKTEDNNLQGMTRDQHNKHHFKLDTSDRICLLCGSNETYINKNTGRPNWYNYENGKICKRCWYKRYPKQHFNHICVICNSNYTSNAWYKFNDEYICNRCYSRKREIENKGLTPDQYTKDFRINSKPKPYKRNDSPAAAGSNNKET